MSRYYENSQKFDLSLLVPELFTEENSAVLQEDENLTVCLDLFPLFKSFRGLVVDMAEESDTKNAFGNWKRRNSIGTQSPVENIEYTVHKKKFYSGKELEYFIYFISVSKGSDFIPSSLHVEREEDRKDEEENKEELHWISDQHSVSTSSASISSAEVQRRFVKDLKSNLVNTNTSSVIRQIRWISFLIMAILITIGSVEIGIKLSEVDEIESLIHFSSDCYHRYNYLAQLSFSFFIYRNIMELHETPLFPYEQTTYTNRVEMYRISTLKIAEKLRSFHMSIAHNKLYTLISTISGDNQVKVKMAKPMISNDTLEIETVQLDYNTIILKFINDAIDSIAIFKNYESNILQGKDGDFHTSDAERFSFFIKNSETNIGSLTLEAAQTASEYLTNNFGSKKSMLNILSGIIFGVAIISIIVILPIITRPHKNIVKVFSFFNKLSNDEKSAILLKGAAFSETINNHFGKIKEFFESINFVEDIKEPDPNEATESAPNVYNTQNSSERQESTPPIEEEQLIPQDSEMADREARLKVVKKASGEWQKILLIKIMIVGVIFSIHFVVEMLLMENFFGTIEKIINFSNNINKRQSTFAWLSTYTMSEWDEYFDYLYQGASQTKVMTTYEYVIDNEKIIFMSLNDLSQFADSYSLYNVLESNSMCNHFFTTNILVGVIPRVQDSSN